MLAVAKIAMTAISAIEVTPKQDAKEQDAQNIVIRGKFKSVDIFNKTLHIVVYPHDGLRAAAKLQEIEEGTDVTLDLTRQEGF